jgi:poly(A) polymerase
MELMKLLVAPRAAPTLVAVADAGLLLRALGGVPYLAAFARMVEIEAAIGEAPDAVRRLGALGVAIVEDAERLWQKLRLTNAEHTRLSAMGEHWPRMSPDAGEQRARTLLYRLKPQAFSDSALLAWARSQAAADDAVWRTFATLPQRWSAPVFPIKAADFIARGIAPGPALGAVLRAAEAAWIAADFPQMQSALEQIAVAAIAPYIQTET